LQVPRYEWLFAAVADSHAGGHGLSLAASCSAAFLVLRLLKAACQVASKQTKHVRHLLGSEMSRNSIRLQ